MGKWIDEEKSELEQISLELEEIAQLWRLSESAFNVWESYRKPTNNTIILSAYNLKSLKWELPFSNNSESPQS
jgi:hypothetical protein